MRFLRLLLALVAVGGGLGGCQALEKDPILGNKPFQPNMNPN